MSHIDTLITDHLDLWCAAVRHKSIAGRGSNSKLELTGIKKLRELILELAVRGKLVPQDPCDEPASVLLERIAAEKAQLLRDGKIKSEKKYPVISDAEQPHSKPDGWVFERFGNVLINRDFERIPLAVSERERKKGGYDYYGASGVIDRIDGYLFDKPLLLIGEDGANLINRSSPIAFIARGKYWVNNHAHVLDGLNEDLLKYVCLHINAISLLPYITGTAQPKMNQAKMNAIVLGIPPLAEQKRIVAKVDELMALCDQLELHSESQLAAHQTLVETLLATLTDSGDADELAQNWARLSTHLDTLLTTEASVDALKQTILQLAVMGKLVPQDPSDESASVLLERIAAEKTRLVKEGKIKKPKAFPEISEEEKPFELPDGWEWSMLAEISEINPRNDSDDTVDASFVPMSLISTTYNGQHEFEARKWGEIKKGFTHFSNGDIGIAKITPCFENSKAAVFRGLINGIGAGTTELHIARPYTDYVSAFFILLNIKSPIYLKKGEEGMTGTAGQKRLAKDFFSFYPLPIPPLAEQHRIVAKVDELMTLCDQLKSRLQTSQQTQLSLAESLTEGALA